MIHKISDYPITTMFPKENPDDLFTRPEPLLRGENNDFAIRAVHAGQSATDIAPALSRLPIEKISSVFAQLDEPCRAELLAELPPEEAARRSLVSASRR